MKLRRVITVATFAFAAWRAWNGMRNDLRKGARRSLKRMAKSI